MSSDASQMTTRKSWNVIAKGADAIHYQHAAWKEGALARASGLRLGFNPYATKDFRHAPWEDGWSEIDARLGRMVNY